MKRIRQLAAALSACLLAFTAALTVCAGELDGSREASVTIHKYLVDGTKTLALEQDGREITDPEARYVYQNDSSATLRDLPGLNGIGFTLTRVQDESISAESAVVYTGNGSYRQTRTTARIGGRDGIAVFENLPHGVYLVEETPSGDYTADMAKFLLNVPLRNPVGDGYLYDIHIYPKNSRNRRDEFTKEVAKRNGSEVVWEFAWEIPDNIESGKSLMLTDELDDRLTYRSVSASYTNRSGNTRTLTGKHYTVQHRSGAVVVRFHSDGFTELKRAWLPESGAKTPKLLIQVNTTIKSSAFGTIYNSGELEYVEGNGDETTLSPKRDPWVDVDDGEGGFYIYKYDARTREPLAGAEFAIYQSRSDALAGRNPLYGSGGVTGPDGYLLIDGLEYDGGKTSYWIVETEAPVVNGTAYNRLSSPIEVRVGPNSHLRSNRVEVANNTGITLPSPIDGGGDVIQNGDRVPTAGFTDPGPGAAVPDSGGMGSLRFSLSGLFLIACALLVFLHNRMR